MRDGLVGVRFGEKGLGFTSSGMLALLEQLPVALAATRGPDHIFVYTNDLYRRIHEQNVGSIEGRTFKDVFGASLPEHHLRLRDQVLREQKSLTSRSILVALPDRDSCWDISLIPLSPDEIQEGGILTIAIEVTAAEKLAREQERLSIAVEATELGIWEWDVSTNTVYWSPRLKVIFGLKPDAEPSHDTWSKALHPDEHDEVKATVAALLDPGSPGHLSLRHRIVRPDGSVRWIAAKARMLYSESGRKPLKLLGTVLDITDRQHIEDELKQALRAKDLLVREAHHRVKNSLQIVSGMLLLQSRIASLPTIASALGDASTRISTVARLHDYLHLASTTDRVELSSYLASLCKEIERIAGKPGLAVSFDGGAMQVPNEFAISIGLIVNELVTNALKYAYPGGQGVVQVSLLGEGAGVNTLIVEDAGIGLPPGFEPASSFGLLMVRTLARQFNAKLQQERVPAGTRFTLAFETDGIVESA